MDMPALHDTVEKVDVSSQAKLARDVEAGRHLDDWLKYFMLPWPHHTLLSVAGPRVWPDAIKFG